MRIKLILISLTLASCSAFTRCAYKMDIRQGNYVTAAMREKLKTGMIKAAGALCAGFAHDKRRLSTAIDGITCIVSSVRAK